MTPHYLYGMDSHCTKGEGELQDATSCNASAETPIQMGLTETIAKKWPLMSS